MEVEVVSFCIPGASTVSCSDMRPTVAIDAEGPQSAISKIDAPATDENIHTKGVVVLAYYYTLISLAAIVSDVVSAG